MSHTSNEPPNARSGTTELTESTRHRLLAAERRRVLIDVLAERAPPVSLEALTAAVAEREPETRGAGTAHRDVAITLHHQHLPVLSDAGVVEYVPRWKRVEAIHAIDDLP